MKRFVHISSLAAREPQLGATEPASARAKQALEPFKDRISIAIIRPPAVYGPGDTATLPLLQSLMQRARGHSRPRGCAASPSSMSRTSRASIADAAGADWTGIREVSDGTAGGYRWRDL